MILDTKYHQFLPVSAQLHFPSWHTPSLLHWISSHGLGSRPKHSYSSHGQPVGHPLWQGQLSWFLNEFITKLNFAQISVTFSTIYELYKSLPYWLPVIILKTFHSTLVIKGRTIVVAMQSLFHSIVMTIMIVFLIYFLILTSTVSIITRTTSRTIAITWAAV